MNSPLVMVAAALFPVAALGLVLWLCRLEESLPRAVRATARKPAPAPILSVPVRPAVTVVRIPVPRQPAAELSERPSVIGA